jgi:succinyl-diaminopimelate desuccinylase
VTASPTDLAALSDPLPLARALIRRPSVTPEDAGALDVLEAALSRLGFRVHRLAFSAPGTAEVANLFARLDPPPSAEGGPTLCFAGHTDVVPPGDGWTVDPFAAEVRDGRLYGRGAADMKAAIAAFVAATARRLAEAGPPPGGLALLITGDEEGPAINGTRKVLEWMAEHGERIDACVVGEPTNPRRLGEMVKIGRRGSINGVLTVFGGQGHVAYPHLADNPIPRLIGLLQRLIDLPLDDGTAHFQPSNLEIVSVDVGNAADNVIPGRATARFNIRFNDRHTGTGLTALVRRALAEACPDTALWDLTMAESGPAFLTPPGALSDALAEAIAAVTGDRPELSTSGGTSDARFLKDACPVAEFGLVGQTMHKSDENCALADLEALTAIYRRLIDGVFGPLGAPRC